MLSIIWAGQNSSPLVPNGRADARCLGKDRRLLQGLAMLGNVESFKLLLQRHADRHESAYQLQECKGNSRRPGQSHCDTVKLSRKQARIAFKQARGLANRG